MASDHIIKSYDDELQRLTNTITEMGGLAETQIARPTEGVMKRNSELAADVIEADARVDKLETEVGTLAVRLLALRQPMARDLREISPRSRSPETSSGSAITPPMSPNAPSR